MCDGLSSKQRRTLMAEHLLPAACLLLLTAYHQAFEDTRKQHTEEAENAMSQTLTFNFQALNSGCGQAFLGALWSQKKVQPTHIQKKSFYKLCMNVSLMHYRVNRQPLQQCCNHTCCDLSCSWLPAWQPMVWQISRMFWLCRCQQLGSFFWSQHPWLSRIG